MCMKNCARANSGATPLELAQRKLFEIAGGSRDSGNPRASRMTTAQRLEYLKSPEFVAWVASEKAAGREVFWLKDVDKTQGAGDVFTFFFDWRARNKKFSPAQLAVIGKFLLSLEKNRVGRWLKTAAQALGFGHKAEALPAAVIAKWLAKEDGGEGIGMLDFWSGAYWPSQIGLSKAEKLAQVEAFAPAYADRVYPGVREENLYLESIGVHVVIVSNGDQELAIACAPYLGVKPENVVGSHLIYENGVATGVNHTYEVTGGDWHSKPQPGKPISLHYWMHVNRARFGWTTLDETKIVIAGRDGDSAGTDGGMMILGPLPSAIGNFMVNTPGEPKRIEQFYSVAAKYGWTRGQFITLDHSPSKLGFKP
ncbi:MAG: hypothetical protein JSS83_17930 [Cyanobacteria bacterium SZAS LIN-3]|nr:hypothetical protein [Cyanobacteria bacterium SZAS LIN-3]